MNDKIHITNSVAEYEKQRDAWREVGYRLGQLALVFGEMQSGMSEGFQQATRALDEFQEAYANLTRIQKFALWLFKIAERFAYWTGAKT